MGVVGKGEEREMEEEERREEGSLGMIAEEGGSVGFASKCHFEDRVRILSTTHIKCLYRLCGS